VASPPHAALRTGVELLEQVVIEQHRARHESVGYRVQGTEAHDREAQVGLGTLRASSATWLDVDAFWLGAAYQRALDVVARASQDVGTRRSRGVFYTPRTLVSFLVERVFLESDGQQKDGVPKTLDPACGCGGFLIGIARYAQANGSACARQTLAGSLHGIDIDPLAVLLCRLGLWLEFCDPLDPTDTPDRFARQVHVADSLLDPPASESFDLVIGNPPFLSQLAASTARSAEHTAALRERFGKALRPYTDPAALFLRLAVDTVRPGGNVGMVLPVSVLGSRDVAAIRSEVSQAASVRSLWLDTTGVFDAGVRAVTVTLTRDGGGANAISRFAGARFEPATPIRAPRADASSWGPLAADLLGVPQVRISTEGGRTLGDLCEITAGFRDEYYAITAEMIETPTSASPGEQEELFRRIATVGMLDPAHVAWGARPFKIAGERWTRPGVRVDGADPLLAALIQRQSKPKLLIATQTRVLEAAADPDGRYVALTPVITVVPNNAADLWWIGALLSSPVVSAWIAAQTFGTARSLTALKPSAALLRQIPVPVMDSAWKRAGQRFQLASHAQDDRQRGRSLRESARDTIHCYSLAETTPGELLDWWSSRLPSPSSDATASRNPSPPAATPNAG